MDYYLLIMGIYVAAATVIGAGISAYGQSASQKSAAKAKQAAYDRARQTIQGYSSKGSDWLAAAFGDSLNPEEFLYKPVDLTASQLRTIRGNQKAAPEAIDLTKTVNPAIWENDTSRIRSLMPQFDAARDSYMGTTRRLQEGVLPFSDVMDITAKSSSAAAASGTPGGLGMQRFVTSAFPGWTPCSRAIRCSPISSRLPSKSAQWSIRCDHSRCSSLPKKGLSWTSNRLRLSSRAELVPNWLEQCQTPLKPPLPTRRSGSIWLLWVAHIRQVQVLGGLL